MKMERIWVALLTWAAIVVAELQGSSGCLEKERMGLMNLWKAIKPTDLASLPSDCCSWTGVHCSAATGRVESLSFFSVESPGYFLNTSLFLPFEELLELNLDGSGIVGLINQAAFANIKNLKYLDLFHNQMNISNLEGICDMKNIVELRLVWNNIRGDLPLCVGNLTRLQILDISHNQIGGNIPSTFRNLSYLFYLDLRRNYFSGAFSLHSLVNNTELKILGISSLHNHFHLETETQSWVPSFQLQFLALSNSNLNTMSYSVIPTFLLNQSDLFVIDLSNNMLQGTFPSWLLQNNSNLQILWMTNNFLTGNLVLPNFIHGLTRLSISNNMIDGKLPDNLPVFLPALEILNISKNRFEGNLPSSFGALETLQYVDLSFNSFTGELPKTLFANNSDLFYIDFSNNCLQGEISLNLTALPSRRLSRLQVFDISNNLISGILPNSIADFTFLSILKLSNNSFEGGIPDKLCHINELVYLDISHNNFSGSIPFCLRNSSIEFLYMRNCNLSGVIPDGFSNKSMLKALDLSYNDFSLSILPNWIYSQHQLQILGMAGLQLEGEISMQLCGLGNIKLIDLSHNNFNGSIPSCLFKMPFWGAETQDDNIDLRLRHFSSIHLIPSLIELFEAEFTTKGRLMKYEGSILNHMTGLDISSNKLSGQIPPQIGDLEAIHALNLSNNRFWGSIPSNISRLRAIESLDLSSNNLSGKIPSEIVGLTFLSFFNVSNNNLSGPIPKGGEFYNFDEQNYGGNEFLCGPLLHRVCTINSPSTPPNEQNNDDETIFEITSFWWSFEASYVTVIILIFVLLGINTHFSRVWFHAVDVFCAKLLCVFVKMKFLLPRK